MAQDLKPHSPEAALAQMAGRRALLIGDTMLDAYVFGETARVSREAPVLVVREERREYRLGAAANTAANLAALGLEVDVLGLLGHDGPATILRELLQEAGCSLQHMLPTARPTAIKTRILAGAYGTSKQQVLRLDTEPQGEHAPETHTFLAARLRELGPKADVVVVSDYGAGMVQGPVIDALRELAGAGVPVCVDSRYHLRRFHGMTALTPNVPEAEAVVGHALQSRAAVEQAGSLLMQQLECEALVITQGKEGMSLFRPQGPVQHLDVMGSTEVTDVTGAGDSVIATLSAALAAGLGLKNGTLLANCAAGIVVTRMGTASASPQDILAAARAHKLRLEAWT